MTIKNSLPAIHPGEFLKEALEELGTSPAEFARAIGNRLRAVRPLAHA